MEGDFGRTLESYKALLEKARRELPEKIVRRSRFVVPTPVVEVVGRKKTVIRNFKEIADVLNRPPAHIAKYFTKILATPASVVGKELVIRGQHPRSRIVQILRNYIQEYVICPVCGAPDTELVRIEGILYKRCKACGARTPVKELRAIFQPPVNETKMFRFLTLDDVLVTGRLVLLRVDINVPIEVGSGKILDDTRIRAILPTLEALSESRVVIIAHQSRPGYADFTSLEPHYHVLRDLRGDNVYFVPDVIGPEARRRIEKLKPGDVLMLDNVRLLSEEVIEMSPEKAARTIFVRRLAPLFNIYVNDAFATAHRSQPSLVGFPEVLPAVAGKLMERELNAINKALYSDERPKVFVIGGGKIKTKLAAALRLLEADKADKILFGGAVANALLAAKGLVKFGIDEEIRRLAESVLSYEERVVLPRDGAVERDGERLEGRIEELPEAPLDIGPETVEEFSEYILSARVLVANGPMGMFEKPGFDRGTRRLIEVMARSGAYKLIGGGHLGTLVKVLGMSDRFDRVSTGGGALLYALSGKPLPAVAALERYYEKFHGFAATRPRTSLFRP